MTRKLTGIFSLDPTKVGFINIEVAGNKFSLIQAGLVCPYCNKPYEFNNSTVVYGASYGMIYAAIVMLILVFTKAPRKHSEDYQMQLLEKRKK